MQTTSSLYKSISLRFIIVLFFVAAFTYLAFYQCEQPLVGIDDANIFFVYAKHLATGHGIVYHIGGERVEGFTSFLWMLICSLFFYLVAEPEIWLLILNIFLIAGAFTILSLFLDHHLNIFTLHEQQNRSALSTSTLIWFLWVFANPAYFIWTILTLMDTGLWAAVLAVGVVLSVDFMYTARVSRWQNVSFAIIVLLILLTRPEGILWAFTCILTGFIALLARTHNLKDTFKVLLPALLTYLGTLMALTLFRLVYFGYPLPNTYYVKVSSDVLYNVQEGLKYFLKFSDSNSLILICLITVIPGLGFGIKRYRSLQHHPPGALPVENTLRVQYWALALFVLVGISIPILTGGDNFGLFRAYQPLWPILIFPCYAFVKLYAHRIEIAIKRQHLRELKLVIVFSLIVLFYHNGLVTWRHGDKTFSSAFKVAENQRILGYFLNTLFEKEALPKIGVLAAGGIALAYNGETIDLLGLNNTLIAHVEGDKQGRIKGHTAFQKDLFFRLKPDILLPYFLTTSILAVPEPDQFTGSTILEETKQGIWSEMLKGLFADERFLREYALAIVTNHAAFPNHLLGFFQKDYLLQLAKNQDFRIKVLN